MSHGLVEIKNFVRKELENGRCPSYKELNKKFLLGYKKITLKDIYPNLRIKILDLKCKRPQASLSALKKELIEYVKNEFKLNHFPTRRELEYKFRLRLSSLFKNGIQELYEKAGSKYKQKINQELKYKKADLLNKVIISILPKLKLNILNKRKVYERGVDLITIDNRDRKIGLELKAYNKFEPIKINHIKQALRFIKNENLYKLFIVTSTSKIEKIRLPKGIEFIDYDKLKILCNDRALKILNYIRETSVNIEPFYKIKKKQVIIEYAKNRAKLGKDISYNSILKDLHMDLYSYFSNLNEVYKEAGLNIPLKKIKGTRSKNPNKEEMEKIVNKISEYMKREVKKGYYPTGQDIKRNLDISHIWNIISMTELYKRIGEEPYQKRRVKKKKII